MKDVSYADAWSFTLSVFVLLAVSAAMNAPESVLRAFGRGGK